jgi:two-component system phosphate regulon sensor histidine kinase PhoR
MQRGSFFWKLYAGYAALILITTAIVGGLAGRLVARNTRSDVQRDLTVNAHLLREVALDDAVAARDAEAAPELQARILSLSSELETRLTVIRADGVVLADSERDPTTLENHGTRPEVLEARERGQGSATRFSGSIRRELMYVAVPMRRDGQLIGYARTSLPLDDVGSRIRDLWIVILLGALGAATVALGLGYVFARYTLAPLGAMTEAAQEIADGAPGPRMHLRRTDEIGQLAEAFTSMSAQLRARMETITADRNRLRAIFGSMVEGVIAVDSDQRVVHLNDVAARLLGTLTSSAPGRPIWEITRMVEITEAVSEALEEGTERRGELTLHAIAGDRLIDYQVAPLRREDGQQAGAVMVLHDVTELRRLESMRRDFVANVSHELKTPLTAIRGLVETMDGDSAMPTETRDRFMSKIKAQTDRLLALVSDLLAISRLESQVSDLPRTRIDLCTLAHERIETRSQVVAAAGRGIEFHDHIPDTAVEIVGDRESIGRIIDNLLDNALDYTPSGGRIDFRIGRQGNEATIEVQDTGIGIEKRHHERIFERFYRVDSARSRELGGTGLGLSIVKRAAVAHGGRVSVESTPGSGSTFRAWLPLADVGETAAP